MAIDKYSQLKIAANVLGTTIKGFADELDVTVEAVRSVASGKTTSARISKFIDSKISEANQIYDQHRKKKRLREVYQQPLNPFSENHLCRIWLFRKSFMKQPQVRIRS